MPVHYLTTRRRRFVPLALSAFLTVVFSAGLATNEANAQSTTNNNAKGPNPATSFKVPPRPILSGHFLIQPGMSKKDWADAYKETGRPKFKLNTVKRAGGTVERD
jgi:hypothetical protein